LIGDKESAAVPTVKIKALTLAKQHKACFSDYTEVIKW
jgi:hypothetical protein